MSLNKLVVNKLIVNIRHINSCTQAGTDCEFVATQVTKMSARSPLGVANHIITKPPHGSKEERRSKPSQVCT